MSEARQWSTADGRATARLEQGIRVLHLSGSRVEMARQHGELLATEVRRGVLAQIPRLLSHYLRYGPTRRPLIRKLATTLIERLLVFPMTRQVSARQLEPLLEGARVAGIDPGAIAGYLGVVDVMAGMTALNARTAGWLPGAMTGAGISGAHIGGCSGFVAGQGVTADGHLLQGRNLDFDLVGLWDRFPTVAFCTPRRGMRYVSISTAGMPTAGLTGLNEAGLFVAESTLATFDISLKQPPFFIAHDRIVRRCRTLDDAIGEAANGPNPGGYAIHLGHGPTHSGAIVERTAHRAAVRRLAPDGWLVETNYIQDPALRATVPGWHFAEENHARARVHRISTGLEAHRGRLAPADAAGLLGDQVDPAVGEVRPLGDVVANFMGVQSVVADLTAMQLWVSADPAPTGTGRYVGFDVEAEWSGDGSRPKATPKSLPAGPQRDTAHHEGVRRYIDAYQAYRHVGAPDAACELLDEAARLDPAEPNYHFARALLSLRQNEIARARYELEVFRAAPNSGHRHGHALLVQGWCEDLAGRRSAARAAYAAIADHVTPETDPWLLRHAHRAMTHAFTERTRRDLDVDFFSLRPMLP